MQEIKELNQLLSKYVDQGCFPGFQWQINIDEKIYSGKYGLNNIENKKPVLDNTIYRIWSMTKPIVAVVAMQLIEKKIIKLEDPITEYLPEFKNLKVLINEKANLDETEDVHEYPTIKDLLLHTAGFSYNSMGDPVGKEYDRIELFHSDTTTLETEVKKIAKVPLLFKPKKKWRYSVSMDVLGRIIEVVKNDSLQNILEIEIFNPLEMHETRFSVAKKSEHRVMESYAYDPLKSKLTSYLPGPQKLHNYQYPTNEEKFARGGHGLFSTIKDYSIFANMLHSGKSKNGEIIINPQTLKMMNSNALEDYYFPLEITSVDTVKDKKYVNDLEPYGWGMGFRTLMEPEKNKNLGSYGEFGWSGYAATYFLVDDKKNMSALIMTQVFNALPNLQKDFYKYIYTNF